MKTPWCSILVALCLGTPVAPAQQRDVAAEPSQPVVAERGPHHRVIERTVQELQPDGTLKERKSSYTELATGLHYLKDGQWVESREEIEIFNGAAVARQGQHQVIFAANLNSPGAIDLLAADGQRFRSHVLGLIYTDYASGRSVMIAEIKDSIGELTSPNQVTYPDAFDGACIVDVRYIYTKGGFEQDIILRTAPPSPAEWGLDPETTRLEVFTEFIEAPAAQVTSVTLKREENDESRRLMKEPDLVDQRLDFGGLVIGQGQAFPLGEQGDLFGGGPNSVPTGKSLERIEGRLILIEKVDYPAVLEQLGRLPKSAALNRERKVGLPDPLRTLQARVAPPRPVGLPGRWTKQLQASIKPQRPGFVLDYISFNASSLTNYTFKSDTTYMVNGDVKLYGTTTIEGGTVVKFTNATYAARLLINGPLDCKTSAYRPAFFTARDDGTIGEAIAGAASLPSAGVYYGARVLDFSSNTNLIDLHDIRIRYGDFCIVASGANVTVSHSQISKSLAATYLTAKSFMLRNVLLHDLAYGFYSNSTNVCENVTFHRIGNLNNSSATRLVYLTNSLLISTTNATYSGAYTISNRNDSGFFQTVGAATHYLASGSTNRDAGSTNVTATLLAALKKKTTFPPIVLTNAITNDTTLTLQATRDTDTPDLGYHYDPLDYAGTALIITNATLTLQSGTALGLYGSSSSHSLLLLDGGKVISEGTPENLNRIVRFDLSQEHALTNWSATSVSKSISTPGTYSTNTYTGEARLRFTDFSMPAGGADHLYLGATNLTVNVRDCQFLGGQVTSLRPDVTILNNLFERVAFKLYSPVNGFTALMRNSTHFGGSVTVSNNAGGTWTLRDNLFDGNSLLQNGTVGNNYNAYLTNGTRLTPNGANDVVLTVTNVTYETGWLGKFYVPTNLTSHGVIFNAGSQNATNSGLYHYTMVTNQTPELSTVVDIGFHYVAVGSSGVPLDGDGDGLANYFEDSNGNGSVDSGEYSWQLSDTDGDGVSDYLEYLLGRNALQSGSTTDSSGTLNLRVYTPLK
jgi:hypothetical protein